MPETYGEHPELKFAAKADGYVDVLKDLAERRKESNDGNPNSSESRMLRKDIRHNIMLFADWYSKTKTVSFSGHNISSLLCSATEFQDIYPAGKNKKGEPMGIDKVLKKVFNRIKEDLEKVSIARKDRKEEWIENSKRCLSWKEEVPISCPMTMKKLDDILAIADKKFGEGWRSSDREFDVANSNALTTQPKTEVTGSNAAAKPKKEATGSKILVKQPKLELSRRK